MKTSQIGEAVGLRNDLRHVRTLQAKTERFPRYAGYMVLDGERLNMTHAEVDALIERRLDEVGRAAFALGLEVDE